MLSFKMVYALINTKYPINCQLLYKESLDFSYFEEHFSLCATC